MSVWVKICGITRVEDARAAVEAGADAIGINFWAGSRRHCAPSRARGIVRELPRGFPVFGVFVRAPRTSISDLVREVGLTGVQFHGEEALEEALGWDVPVIRAIAATGRNVVAAALAAAGPAAAPDAPASDGWPSPYRVLVDHASGGGSGRIVDEGVLDELDLGEAIVAGGLTPENVAAIVARRRPFGVDTAGGVEASPGIKDAHRLVAFIRAARGGEEDR